LACETFILHLLQISQISKRAATIYRRITIDLIEINYSFVQFSKSKFSYRPKC